MAFLRLLESLRTPFLNGFFSAVTYCGDQIFFFLAAMTLYWCIEKRSAYYTFCVCLLTIVCNQYLKIIFEIPRPWIIDPDFTIVESARAAAEGFSFPSGHTQNVVALSGCIALCFRKRAVRAVCLIFAVLVSFSRMYLGVHTPLDVGGGAAISLGLVFALFGLYACEQAAYRKKMPVVFALIGAFLIGLLILLSPRDKSLKDVASGVKNAWTLLGCLFGFATFWFFDEYRLSFEIKAPLPGQLLKVAGGLASMLLLKEVLKAPLYALFGGSYFADFWRYWITVGLVGCLWPMSFSYLSKIGKKEETQT